MQGEVSSCGGESRRDEACGTLLQVGELYAEKRWALMGYFVLTCGEFAAEDLCQEVFVRMCGALRRGAVFERPERVMWRTAQRVKVDWYRSQNGRGVVRPPQEVSLDVGEWRVADTRDGVGEAIERVMVGQALDGIRAEHGAVLRLRLEGLEYGEIAERLGLNGNTCKGWGARGMAKMREEIGEE